MSEVVYLLVFICLAITSWAMIKLASRVEWLEFQLQEISSIDVEKELKELTKILSKGDKDVKRSK